MATIITAECINCGACEPECPNTAIYQGGVEWEQNGLKHPPISNEVFYIVPQKCTECVGFHDHEACAAVCPVDVCIPDPNIPESEEVLLQRAKELHPDVQFPADFPSRFNPGRGTEGAPAAAAAAGDGTAAPATAPVAVAAAAPVAAKAAAPGGRVERPLSPPQITPRPPRQEKSFPGELSMTFDHAAALLKTGKSGKATIGKFLVALAQPLLGALPYKQKRAIEQAVADRRFFTASGATGLNALHNFIIYPVIFVLIGAIGLDRSVFTEHLKYLIALGVVIATIETVWRMREGFQGRPQEEVLYRAAVYGVPMGPLASPVVRLVETRLQQGNVVRDGFSDPRFEEKIERERRYGEVYRLLEESNGYLLQLEFPRKVPPSGAKEELGIPDEMPDYEYDIALQNGFLVVKGKVTDPNVRKIAAVSSAFPPDFTQNIKLPGRVAGFRHRFADRTLEVALPTKL
jgi:ferredoxin